MTRIINLIGGPGSGKSTLASGIFCAMKYEGRQKTLENQLYVLGKQYHRISRLIGKVEYIITDSPILLSAYYIPTNFPRSFKQLVLDLYREMNQVTIFVERVRPYSENGRNQNEEQANLICVELKKFLADHKISYHTFEGRESTVDKILRLMHVK